MTQFREMVRSPPPPTYTLLVSLESLTACFTLSMRRYFRLEISNQNIENSLAICNKYFVSASGNKHF